MTGSANCDIVSKGRGDFCGVRSIVVLEKIRESFVLLSLEVSLKPELINRLAKFSNTGVKELFVLHHSALVVSKPTCWPGGIV
jgi:hypothetical protein